MYYVPLSENKLSLSITNNFFNNLTYNHMQFNTNYKYKKKPTYEKQKRFLDIFISVILIIFLLPLFILIIIISKIYLREKIFFVQKRVGLNGKIFNIIKFRTMIQNAEDLTGPVWAIKSDPRCTTLGKFLRKTSLDELPQLINIIKGEMSLIGPRPERPELINKYPELSGLRLKIKPGLTGLAQVNGRYVLDFEEKLMFDLEYVTHRNLWLDFKIICKTIPVVLSCTGAW